MASSEIFPSTGTRWILDSLCRGSISVCAGRPSTVSGRQLGPPTYSQSPMQLLGKYATRGWLILYRTAAQKHAHASFDEILQLGTDTTDFTPFARMALYMWEAI